MSANLNILDRSKLRRVSRIPDIAWAPFWEAFLILVAGATAYWSGHPWLFSSLGPTAYELVEKPELPSARPYNVILGHFVAIGCGFLGVALFSAWAEPTVNAHSLITWPRVWASTIGLIATVALNLLLGSSQPAACSTALLVSLGGMQTAYAALWIAVGVLIVDAIGEPIRRIRLRALGLAQQQRGSPFRCRIATPPASPPHNLAA
jgi:hypothetical protein